MISSADTKTTQSASMPLAASSLARSSPAQSKAPRNGSPLPDEILREARLPQEGGRSVGGLVVDDEEVDPVVDEVTEAVAKIGAFVAHRQDRDDTWLGVGPPPHPPRSRASGRTCSS